MAELLEQIALWVEALTLLIGYPGVFLVMFIENLFPPFPSDPLIPFAGILAAQGHMNFVIAWAAAVLGAVTGSLILYAFGAWADERVVRQFIRRYGKFLTVSEAEFDRALELFNRYGAPMIVFGRMLPVLRAVISIAAGTSRMQLGRFALYTTISSMISVFFWMMLGYVLGENWRTVFDFIDRFEPLFIVLGVIAGVAVVVWYVRRYLSRRQTHTNL